PAAASAAIPAGDMARASPKQVPVSRSFKVMAGSPPKLVLSSAGPGNAPARNIVRHRGRRPGPYDGADTSDDARQVGSQPSHAKPDQEKDCQADPDQQQKPAIHRQTPEPSSCPARLAKNGEPR
ncbi:MAG: hypothetical protein ABJ117_09460, partial [Alphaproteobacteria bacterium]